MGGALTGAGGVHRSAPCERIGTAVSPGGTAGCKWHHTRGCGLRSQVGTTPGGVGDPRATEFWHRCLPRGTAGCKWHHTRGCGLRSQVGTTPEGVGDPRATEFWHRCLPRGTAGCKWHHTRGCGLRSQVGTTPGGVGDPRATEAAPGWGPVGCTGVHPANGLAPLSPSGDSRLQVAPHLVGVGCGRKWAPHLEVWGTRARLRRRPDAPRER